MQTNLIRGRAVAKYGSLSQFALELGWAPNKISRIINNKQPLTIRDALKMASALDIEDSAEFLDIFVPETPQM